MSSELSNREFPESTKPGFLGFVLSGIRSAWRATDVYSPSQREADLADLVERLAQTFPDPTAFPPSNGNLDQWREDIAVLVGVGVEGGENDILLDEVLAAYEAQHGPISERPMDAWELETDDWSRLDAAVGGDLWTNPAKLETMRRLDGQTADLPWNEFHALVVEACATIPDAEPAISLDNS